MTTERSNFHVLTGGSGSGKSSIVAELKRQGHVCAEEAGRGIVRQQVAIGGDGTPWQDRIKFRELLLSRSIDIFEGIVETDRPVFFDRGIPETIGYCRFLGVPVPPHLRAAAALYRYAPTVYVTPPWREIYETDAERRQSWDDAVADYRVNVDAYAECGYRLVEVPRAPVTDRAALVLRHVGS